MRGAWLSLALLTAGANAGAWCRTTTVPEQPDPTVCPAEGRPVAWPTSCAGFRFDPSVLPDPSSVPRVSLNQALARSARAWSVVACDATRATPSFTLARMPDGPVVVGYNPSGNNLNAVVFRTTWARDAFHPPDAAAVTLVTFGARTATIFDADTELNLHAPENPRGFIFSVSGDPTSADLQTILTHEFGHVLGLAHSGRREAVMWYTAGRGEQRQEPTADDIYGVCAIYPPGRTPACDVDLYRDLIVGGGTRCAASVGAAPAPVALLVLAAALIARRRG